MNDDFQKDPEASKLARRLAKSDFSAESKIRAPLRAKLLAREKSRGLRAPYPALWKASFALAALALILPLKNAFKGEPSLPRGELGLPILPGYIAPREPAKPQPLIETAAGRVIPKENGSQIVWELDGAVYALETRRISLDELIEKHGGVR